LSGGLHFWIHVKRPPYAYYRAGWMNRLRFRPQRINHWPYDQPLARVPESPHGARRARGVLGPLKAAVGGPCHLGINKAPATQ
jgi:hypothetical protein